MNKKVLITIIVLVVLVAVATGGYFIVKGAKPVTLDLATISNNIMEAGFSKMPVADVDNEVLTSYMQVDTANVEEVYGKMPMMNVQASMYILIKAKDGTVETVKQNVEAFGQRYEDQWAMYLPAQHELVQNRKIGVIGNYVYMIIAENADEMVSLIK